MCSDPDSITIECNFGVHINTTKKCLDQNNEPTSNISYGKEQTMQFGMGRDLQTVVLFDLFKEPKTTL